MVIRKLRKVASSYYVILDKTYLRSLGLHQGDYVIVSLAGAAIRIARLKVKEEKRHGRKNPRRKKTRNLRKH